MARMRDLLHAILSGEAPPPPVATLVGFRMVSAGGGEAVVELEADERHTNPIGTVHGGVLCDIADAAMGMAFASTLGEDVNFATLELKINFFKPVRRTRLRAVGRVVREGHLISLIECDVLDSRGALVARASSTCMKLRAANGEPR